jgi:hypothetical protein
MLKTLSAVNSLLATLLGFAIVGLVGAGGYFGYQAYHADKFELEEKEAELAKRQEKIQDLSLDLQSKQRELEVLDDELRTSKQQVMSLSQDVQLKEKKITALNEDVSQKAEEIESLNTEVEQQKKEILALNEDIEAKIREIEQLNVAMGLLKVDHRVAQIDVLSQEGSAQDDNLVTTVGFVELSPEGKPLEEPRVFKIQGDVIYISSLVVKFTDKHVELGDPLRSTSVCLFQKIFGESQEPRDGFSLDPEGSQPAAYRTGGKMSDFEQEIWSRFWDYANDPVLAEKYGVRAAHGEAPFQKVVPGKRYKLQLRSSGGLTIVPEDLPGNTAAEAL